MHKMVKLKLRRDGQDETCTWGSLFVDGAFFCRTLEPPPVRYRIPEGSYKVTGYYPSKKFKGFRPLVHVKDGHSGILIHEGNTAADTVGCILVGRSYHDHRVADSRAALTELMCILDCVDDITIDVV